MSEVSRTMGENQAYEDQLAEAGDGKNERARRRIERQISIAPTSAISGPQLRTTISAAGPACDSPNVERIAACGAKAA